MSGQSDKSFSIHYFLSWHGSWGRYCFLERGGGLGEDKNLNRLARVVNTARRQWNLNPGSLCLRSTRVETVLNLTILSCVSWDAWKWRMARFPAGWGCWLLDLTISDLETEMNVWAVRWDVVALPTKGGYPLVHYGKEGDDSNQIIVEMPVCVAVWFMFRGSKNVCELGK